MHFLRQHPTQDLIWRLQGFYRDALGGTHNDLILTHNILYLGPGGFNVRGGDDGQDDVAMFDNCLKVCGGSDALRKVKALQMVGGGHQTISRQHRPKQGMGNTLNPGWAN